MVQATGTRGNSSFYICLSMRESVKTVTACSESDLSQPCVLRMDCFQAVTHKLARKSCCNHVRLLRHLRFSAYSLFILCQPDP